MELSDPLRKLVGGATAKVLADSLGLYTIGDLLRHYPRRYATRGELTELSSLRLDEHVTVLAEVRRARTRPIRGPHRRTREILEVVVTDGRGELDLAFFARTQYHRRQLLPGRRALFAGKVGAFPVERDDLLLMESSGGGGFGDGLERDPAMVAAIRVELECTARAGRDCDALATCIHEKRHAGQ